MTTRLRFLLWVVLALGTWHAEAQTSDKLLIAAASDLKFALDSVVSAYLKNNGGSIDVTYGSSGKLSEQIQNGAPFDLFFSADISYPDQLREKGFASSEVYKYGVGRIVLWSKKIDPEKEGMKSLLQPSVKKVAIANPMHAPYGKKATEAISYYKLDAAVKDKLVLGENISQTAQFITSGAADIGIIAYSLAISTTMKSKRGKFFMIPEEAHSPLEQGVIITSHGKGNIMAVKFLEFVKSDGVSILADFGFKKPQ